MRMSTKNAEDAYFLSSLQEGLLFHSLDEPAVGMYVLQIGCTLVGRLDLPAFEAAWQQVIERHPPLRTAFAWKSGARPLQVVGRKVRLPLVQEDWSDLPAEERQRRWADFVAADRRRGFDLSRAPLMRLALIREADDRHRLLWTHHHLIMDGWSEARVLGEVFTLYEARAEGREPALPVAPPFRHYISWLGRQDLAAAEAFWRSSLAGFVEPTPLLAGSERTPGAASGRQEHSKRRLPEAAVASLTALARARQITVGTLAQAAFVLLLGHYSGKDDIVFGVTVSGRPPELADVDTMVGMFINTLPFRVDVHPAQALSPWLCGLQERLIEMRQFEHSPLVQVQGWSDVPRGLPLFDTYMVFQNYPVERVLDRRDRPLRVEDAEWLTKASYPLIFESSTSLNLDVFYDTERFESVVIARLLGHLEALLTGFTAHPEGRLIDVPLLTEAEVSQLRVEWRGAVLPGGGEDCLHELCAAQTARASAAIAVEASGEHLTCRELDARATRLADLLGRLDCGPEVVVGVFLERSVDLAVALLAVLKAGAAYLPLDPSYPRDRLAWMLEDSGAPVVIMDRSLAEVFPSFGGRTVHPGDEWGSEGAPVPPAVSPDQGAYLIYTSGSTGRPKGVVNTHRAILNRLLWMQEEFPLGAHDAVLQKTPLSFDASIWEIFLPLLTGARLVLARPGGEKDPSYLARVVTEREITVLQLVPSLLAAFLECEEVTGCVSLRRIFSGGEALPAELRDRCLAQLDAVLCNLYGPTECSIDATYWVCHRDDRRRPVPVGRPIANTVIRVLDAHARLVPAGVAGELHIAGRGLARGYLGRPDLTAERFVPDPFGESPGERLYKTGDVARHRPDGIVEYLGRADHQVKIRGFRIELGEIESVLSQHPSIREVAVLAKPARAGGQQLVAYLVPASAAPPPELAELRLFAREKLPEHMLPGAFVVQKSLPKAPSGKLDRRALAGIEPDQDRVGFERPRTLVQELLAYVWAEVLAVPEVGAKDDFFELGGHSLLVMQVTTRVKAIFGVKLRLRAFFEKRTLEGVAEVIEAAIRSGERAEAPPITAVPRDLPLPLSFAQQRLWFIDQLEPGSPLYNLPAAVRMRGRLDVRAFDATLAAITARHEVLRTAFPAIHGQPFQVIAPARRLPLSVVDLGDLGAERREGEVVRLAVEDASRPFDLARGPVLRACLLLLEYKQYVALLNVHHIASDAWSLGIFLHELEVLYRAFTERTSSPLPRLPIQYADFASWQRGWLTGEVLGEQLLYWREKLAAAPAVLDLPLDRPRSSVPSPRGAYVAVTLQAAVAEALRGLGRRLGLTPFMIQLAAFQVLLSRVTGQQDVLVGTPIAGRNRLEIENLIGFFVNTLVLRTDLTGALSFRDLLGRVRETTLGAYGHQDLPFERLVEELQIERSLSHSPLFQVMCSTERAPSTALALVGVALEPVLTGSPTVKFDLHLFVGEDLRSGSLDYRTDLFDRTTAVRLAAHLGVLLAGSVATPEARLSDLPMLSAAERFQLTVEWNATEAEYSGAPCLHELVAGQIARTPEAVAVVFEGHALSYGELGSHAERWARRLRELAVGPESVVGVCLERSLDLVVALLAVLEAGGAYLPLDPTYPEERLAWMVAESRVAVVVTERRLEARLAAIEARRLCIDAEPRGQEHSDAIPGRAAGAENAAYVIFTSGSTGRPKGVINVHRGIRNRLLWLQAACPLGVGDRVLQKTPFSFDVSVWEIFWPLISGAALVVARPQGHQDSHYLSKLIAREGVTTLHFVPSMLQVFLEEPDLEECRSVRRVIASGEALSFDLQQRFFERLGAELRNLYGPTEAAVEVTSWVCHPEALSRIVPIGRPIANLEIHLLDFDLNTAAIGIAGELHIGGVGLARGYLGRPDLTAERFVPNPIGRFPGSRLYRTGDLARRLAGGEVEFLGRLDHQVKIRGFRIELGEIEVALAALPGVRETVVLAREDRPGDQRLVAYLVARAGETLAVSDLRSALGARLPSHLVPAAFVLLPALPLSAHGKVDRRALARLGDLEMGHEGAYVAPRTPEEELVAQLFAEMLRLDRVSADDNFFARGGHSLLATRLASRVREAFRVELPLRAVFEQPTVAGLAHVLEELRRGEQGWMVPPIARLSGHQPTPLSFAQQRLWILHELDPGSAAYNMPIALGIKGPLAIGVLARCLGEIARRHESLRTTFAATDGTPMQVVHLAAPWLLPVIDLTPLNETLRAGETRRLAAEEAAHPFDFQRGPLLRVRVIRREVDVHAVLFTLHHIVSDEWSMGVLVRELNALYGAFLDDRPSPLPELPVQYADFSVWQREWLRGEVLERQLSYWRRQLGGELAALELPTDHARPPLQTYRGTRQVFAPPQGPLHALDALGRREGATLFMTLLAAFQSLLHRYTGQLDISLGTLIAGRRHHGLENLIGFFANALVIRADLSREPTFRQVLIQARETVLNALAYQDLPFERLVDELKVERDVSRSPLFQVLFTVQEAAWEEELRFPGLELEPLPRAGVAARFDLTLSFTRAGTELLGSLLFNHDLFEPATAARLVEHLGVLLAGIAASPETPLSDLPLLGAGEIQQLVAEWNPSTAEPPREQALHELFEEQVESRPEAVALVFEGRHLSYGALEAQANRLACYLGALGVGPEVPVGLCAERSLELVVGLLGILKAGGAYVPLDPSYPADRLAFLLEDTLMPVLVGQERLLEHLPLTAMTQLALLDADRERIARCSPARPAAGALADTLAYITYTSGSTGRPKGVAVAHRGVVRLVKDTDFACLDADLVFLHLAPISFDASTLEIWAPLLNGGRLVIAPPRTPSLAAIGEIVAEEGVTALWLTAGLFHEMIDSHLTGLSGVRQILAGGDVLSPTHVRRLLEALPGSRLVNGYGPTENTTFTACHGLSDPSRVGTSVPIGRPISGTEVYLLDGVGGLAPSGAVSELYAGGAGLARGYFNRPDLTAERWVPDGVSGLPGRRLYRTGDLARWSRRGELEFLGRVDHQVKVRGFRIEPGEIETALRADPRVLAAVVLALGEGAVDRRLVAYVVAEAGREPAERELREALRERLPEYMVPAAVVLLGSLPLTPNGKVDRRALPLPETVRLETKAGATAFRTPLEGVIAAIWCEVLGLERVGRGEDFFDLGGHSLLATRVISQLRRTFEVELGLHELFAAPTVAGLASRVEEELRSGARVEALPIVPVARDRDLPLSFAQQRLWFLAQLDPDAAAYNIPIALEVSGGLRREVLAAVLTEIVRRHEALRTVFAAVEGSPRQVIRAASPLRPPLVDLSGLESGARERTVLTLATEEASRPFDLEHGPLMRAALLWVSEEKHVALISMHHIVSDGWSMGILVREVVALYEAFTAGRPSPLPELPVQYADFAHWQRRWLQGDVLENELSYWRGQLAGAPTLLELPADRPRPPVASGRGRGLEVVIPASTATALAALSRREGATLFMTLLATFYSLLSRYSGRTDLVVGTDIANRNRGETEGLIGFFVNQLVLRADLSGDPSFGELLDRVRKMALGAYLHQDLPFEKLVQEVSPERDLSKQPIFQVAFALQNLSLAIPDLRDLSLRLLPGDNGTAKVDLSMMAREVPRGLALGIEYSTDLFEEATIARLLEHYGALLGGLAERPTVRISELAILSSTECHLLLEDLGRCAGGLPNESSAHEVFARRAAETPEAVAAVCGPDWMTYGALNLRAERIALHLLSGGVGREDRVGVFGERGLGMLAMLLGILKSGAAFVPLEPSHPDPHLKSVLETAGLCRLATEEKLLGRVRGLGGAQGVVCWDETDLRPPRATGGIRLPQIEPQQIAYVLYTSGSTGVPKGVMIPQAGMLNHLLAEIDRLSLDRDSVVAQIASHGFDVSVWQFLAALLTGGRVVIYPPEIVLDPMALLRAMRRDGVSVLETVPTLLEPMLHQVAESSRRGEPMDLPALRYLITSAETLSVPLARRWFEYFPSTSLVNTYGSTECSDNNASHVMRSAPPPSYARVPVGRPLKGVRFYLLDPQLNLVPAGCPGQIAVGGVAVGRGYLGDAAKTAAAFVPDPFGQDSGARLYLPGDLGRWLSDGALDFLGRRDHQVKVRGNRVELGEIEAALRHHPAIRSAVVLVREDTPGDKLLVAYVVAAPEGDASPGALGGYLREVLPSPLVPSVFVRLESLPLTSNGKVDRKALPVPAPEMREVSGSYLEPEGPIEEALAQVWRQVLGLERVGVHDNFFELGGDSILAIQIVAKAHLSGLGLTPRDLFQHQTIADLAGVVSATKLLSAEQGPVTGLVPLTPIQHWFFEQSFPASQHYNQTVLLRLHEPFDPAFLARTLAHLLAHHDALRLRYRREGAAWVQSGAAPDEVAPFTLVDLSALAEDRRSATLEGVAGAAQTGLDLTAGPLMRCVLFDLGTLEAGRLLITAHHLVVDGVSWRILLEDLETVYRQIAHGEEVVLPPKSTSFKRWAERLREHTRIGGFEREVSHWLALDGVAPLDGGLPIDFVDGENTVSSARSILCLLDLEETTALLQEIHKAYNTQIDDVLLAALALAFRRFTGSESFLVSLEGHGREELFEDLDLSRTVGWFTSEAPVCVDLTGADELGAVVKRVKEELRSVPNGGIGYGALRYLGGDPTIQERLRRLPPAPVVFNYLGQLDRGRVASSPFQLAVESSGPTQSPRAHRSHLLEFNGGVLGGRLEITCTFSANVHRRSTIAELTGMFVEELRLLIAHCLAPEAMGYTPSDFPQMQIPQQELDDLLQNLGDALEGTE
jgi:amino acid adenylation domain-containing protein/non-ribosomal peptide synthase protein (TIGR01720 family)